MLRLIVTLVVAAAIGWTLGQIQTKVATGGVDERFSLTRMSAAELEDGSTYIDSAEALPQFSDGTPRVEVEGGTEFDFGTMQHGEERSHEFLFRNVGNAPLSLEMGTSTCKCTVGELDLTKLAPGQETMVKLTWRAQSVMSEFGQSATIITNDPVRTEVKLLVRGQIASSFVMEPTQLSLGEFSNREDVVRTFNVFCYLEESKQLQDLVWTHEETRRLVSIESRPVELDKEKFAKHRSAFGMHEVTLHIHPGMPIGQLSSRIQFGTDQGEDIGTLEVPVSGRVTGSISLGGGSSFDPATNRVNLGTVRSSEGAWVKIWLRLHGDTTSVPTVASVRPEESLTVTIEEPTVQGSGRLFPIRLEIPKGAAPVNLSGTSSASHGKVVIKTDHGFAEEIPIFVRMVVTK